MTWQASVRENNQLVVQYGTKELVLASSVTDQFEQIARLWEKNKHVIGKTSSEVGMFSYSDDGLEINRLQAKIKVETENAIRKFNEGKSYAERVAFDETREIYAVALQAVCSTNNIDIPVAKTPVNVAGRG